jgi:hypothetical protein
MHPALLQELAAEHVKSLTAIAEDGRRASLARRAGSPRNSGPRGRPRPGGLAQAPAEPDLVPAASFAGLSGDSLPEKLAGADQRDLACQQSS